MVQLFHNCNLERILEGSAWLLDTNMIILKKVTVGEDQVVILMTTTNIWVQVHQLPFGFVDTSVGALVGRRICMMVKYDDENNYGPWWKYMKVRIEIDMEELLKQDLVI